jgi:formylglycine-generating enzyme required for sulfatase activity
VTPRARHAYALLAGTVLVYALASAASGRGAGITDRLGLTLVRIPAGEFLMGSTEEQDQVFGTRFWRGAPPEDDERETEKPQHRVRISKAFYMSAHEVTVAQFRRFVSATGYTTEAEKGGRGGRGFDTRRVRDGKTGAFESDGRYNWRNPGFRQGDDHPVVLVSWNDATAFADWLSRTEKAVYRLPTEAEWEYACRAGTSTWFNFGDDPAIVYRHANLADPSLEKAQPGHVTPQRLIDLGREPEDGYAYTAPVGRYQPNAFGLFDMHGNVWEWCRDRYQRSYYHRFGPKVTAIDPPGPESSDDGVDLRVLRGGSWYVDAVNARASSRLWDAPSDSFCYAGFRIVREL